LVAARTLAWHLRRQHGRRRQSQPGGEWRWQWCHQFPGRRLVEHRRGLCGANVGGDANVWWQPGCEWRRQWCHQLTGRRLGEHRRGLLRQRRGRQRKRQVAARMRVMPAVVSPVPWVGDCVRTVAASPQDFHAAITEVAQWRRGPQEAGAAAPQESSATAGSTWLNEAVAAAPQESHATTGSANQESTANIEQMLQNIMTILEGFGERLSRIEDAVQRH